MYDDPKPVAAVRSAPELASMPMYLAYPDTVDGYGTPVKVTRRTNAEPLPGPGVTVLEPGVANIATADARRASQLAGNPLGIGADLLDPQPDVLAGPVERRLQ